MTPFELAGRTQRLLHGIAQSGVREHDGRTVTVWAKDGDGYFVVQVLEDTGWVEKDRSMDAATAITMVEALVHAPAP